MAVMILHQDSFDQIWVADRDPGLRYGIAAPDLPVLPGILQVPLQVVSLVDHQGLAPPAEPWLYNRNSHFFQSSIFSPKIKKEEENTKNG